MRAPINSIKHMVQVGINEVMGGTVLETTLVTAVADPSTSVQIEQGSIVKAVYIELWVLAAGQQVGSFTFIVEKQSGGQPAPDFSDMATLHDYPNKKNILYTTQGLVGESDANPTPILRTWVKIPKGKQRFGLGDGLRWTISSNIENQTHCGLAIYKEYK